MLTTSFVIPLEIQLSKTQQTEREIKKRLPMYHGKESESRANPREKGTTLFSVSSPFAKGDKSEKLHLEYFIFHIKNDICNI